MPEFQSEIIEAVGADCLQALSPEQTLALDVHFNLPLGMGHSEEARLQNSARRRAFAVLRVLGGKRLAESTRFRIRILAGLAPREVEAYLAAPDPRCHLSYDKRRLFDLHGTALTEAAAVLVETHFRDPRVIKAILFRVPDFDWNAMDELTAIYLAVLPLGVLVNHRDRLARMSADEIKALLPPSPPTRPLPF